MPGLAFSVLSQLFQKFRPPLLPGTFAFLGELVGGRLLYADSRAAARRFHVFICFVSPRQGWIVRFTAPQAIDAATGLFVKNLQQNARIPLKLDKWFSSGERGD